MRTLDPGLVPAPVRSCLERLSEAGYQAFLVGGCVRDYALGLVPSDFDVATDAHPDQVLALFPGAVPIGAAFGTVLVPATLLGQGGVEVHVTTMRSDMIYLDGRRPQGVRFTAEIEEDLSRRDFTVNAMAWDPRSSRLVDPFGGAADLEARLIRAVGDPIERLREDALRTLRAVRFATQLGFDIEEETWRAIEVEAKGVLRLSAERARDELLRILAAPECGRGLWMLVELGLLFLVLPELKGSDRLRQAKRDAPTLLDHLIQTCANCPDDPVLRFAALIHDVGKLHTRTMEPDGRVHFHGHTAEGARIAGEAARRLRLPLEQVERIVFLVEMHMSLDSDLQKKTLRRWVARWGERWVRDLIALGRADREASGWRGRDPVLDAIEQRLNEVCAEESALTPKDLAIDGHDVMRELGCGPGPIVGKVIARLYEHVLEDPSQNRREALLPLVRRMRKDVSL